MWPVVASAAPANSDSNETSVKALTVAERGSPVTSAISPKKLPGPSSTGLGVATVALIDTDCDPDLVDLPIPGNDDSMRSIELIMKMLSDAILAGKNQAAVASQHAAKGAEVAMAVPSIALA